MGSIVKKITKPISKVFDKVIPNEIKPALPYIAAAFPFVAPGAFGAAAGAVPGFSGIQNEFIRQALQRGVLGTGLNIGTQLAQEGNEGEVKLGRAALAGIPAAFTTPGLGANLGIQSELAAEAAGANPGFLSQVKSGGLDVLSKVATAGEQASKANLFSIPKAKALSVPLTQQASFDAMDFAKKAQQDYELELAEYNKFVEDQNLAKVANDEDRARAIYNSMLNAGAFTVDTIRETLGQLNLPSGFFAYGGRVGKANGGSMDPKFDPSSPMYRGINKKVVIEFIEEGIPLGYDSVDEYFEDFYGPIGMKNGGIMQVSDSNNDIFLEQRAEQYMEEGFSPEDAMDKALDDLKNNRFMELKNGGRVGKAEGGIMDLGGREMDMRAGCFIPIGAKEKADDVPARLSKNEFVMTAEAVRNAGNGDINLGAKRMYDTMNKLEARSTT